MYKPKQKFRYFDLIFLYATQILLNVGFAKEIDFIYNLDKIPHLLRFALTDDRDNTPYYIPFSGKVFLEESKKEHKKFTTFYLTGDSEEDNKCFDVIRFETRKNKYTCDTNTIIKVHFIVENTYGQFVQLINMMKEEKIKRYMYYKDDFYIIGSSCENKPNEIHIM